MTRERIHTLMDRLLDGKHVSYINQRTNRLNKSGELQYIGRDKAWIISLKGVRQLVPLEDIRMPEEEENLCDLLDAVDTVANIGPKLASVASSYLGKRESTGYNS